MDIDYRCEHCGKRIRAPEGSAGRTGTCPHCGGPTYIPRAMDDEGEIPLAPLDEQEEQRRQQAAMEDAALHRSLLHDRDPKEKKKGLRRGAAATAPSASTPASTPSQAPTLSPKEINLSVVSYIEAMSRGQLEEADKLASNLAQHQKQVLAALDSLATDDLAGYGLPALPRPVLLGFLKQLRSRL